MPRVSRHESRLLRDATFNEELFKKFDTDQSGRLSLEEVKQALAGMKLPLYLADRIMMEADVKKTGDIDRDEFLMWAEKKEAEVEALFEEIDTNKSKTLTKAEIDAWLKAHNVKASPEDERKLITRISRSSSSEISYDEFRSVLIFFKPTDFALLADQWMHYGGSEETGVALHTPSASAAPKAAGLEAFINGITGAVAASISRTCIAPAERLRFQMSLDGASKFGGSNMACLRHILKEEGIGGLWRGNFANIIRIFPQNGVLFFAKPEINDRIKNAVPNKNTASLLSGMASGFVAQTVIYPLDHVRLRLTAVPGVYSGIFSGMAQMAREEGVPAMYKGLTYANVWCVPYSGVLFLTNDFCKRVGEGMGFKPSAKMGMLYGGIAGVTSVVAAYPIEMTRRKLQAQGIGGRPILYDNLWQCISTVVRTEGLIGLYYGVTANVIKGFPAQAITFGCISLFKPYMNELSKKL